MSLDLSKLDLLRLTFGDGNYTTTTSTWVKETKLLPQGLTALSCLNNYLRVLENLPAGLTGLDCSYNYLEVLENLPSGVTNSETN